MAPIYLNPPPFSFTLVEHKENQYHDVSSPHQADASGSYPFLFNTSEDQMENYHSDPKKVEKHISLDEGSNYQVLTSSSLQPVVNDGRKRQELSSSKLEERDEIRRDQGTTKWMSSKMRLLQKMVKSNCPEAKEPARIATDEHAQLQGNNGNNIRVCTDCKTTKTPLWRSGPQGPKSLCNACGIRQRKARRAMEGYTANPSSSIKAKVNKAPKTQHKKRCKLSSPSQTGKKRCFEDIFALSFSKISAFPRVFPQDEQEGAILLMALSCGLVHS